MSEYTTPVRTTFELQRTAIEQSQQALQNGVEFQKRMNAAALDSLESQEDAQRRTVELTRSAIHGYLDALEATVPGADAGTDEIRETVDEQFVTFEEGHAEAFDVVSDEYAKGVEAYDDFATEYQSTVDEQIDLLLEANEEIEGQTVETVEKAREQFELAEEQFEQVQAQLEEQGEQFQEQLDEQFDQYKEQVQEIQSQIQEIRQRSEERVEA